MHCVSGWRAQRLFVSIHSGGARLSTKLFHSICVCGSKSITLGTIEPLDDLRMMLMCHMIFRIRVGGTLYPTPRSGEKVGSRARVTRAQGRSKDSHNEALR